MKLRRFTDAGVAKTRAFLAAVKESNAVDAVTLDGEPFNRDAKLCMLILLLQEALEEF